VNTLDGRSAVLADDHDRVRAGVRALLEEMGLAVVGEGKDALDAQRLGEQLKPDLLVLDFSMPGPKVGDTLQHLRLCAPATRVLILTAHDDDAFIREALAARVDGYLLKEEAPESLKDAVEAVLAGEGWFSPLVKRKFML
jgi:DNA-binding NarL/FixJ family response regulator